MLQAAKGIEPAPPMWCGRSWEGLGERRRQAFAHGIALKEASQEDAHHIVSAFLEFFDTTGAQLMRDEEEWIFRSLTPAPEAVIKALEEHIEISSLIQSLVREASAGCVDLRVVHALGALMEDHLLREEGDIRPLVTPRPPLRLAR